VPQPDVPRHMWVSAEVSVLAMNLAALWLGAKLGANRGELQRTAVDAGGIGSLSLNHIWTDVGPRGRRLEIYGSGGWVVESPRARQDRAGNAAFCPSDSRFAEDACHAPMPESIGN
jgi:hypothetical protein